jgi:hypothetical protein
MQDCYWIIPLGKWLVGWSSEYKKTYSTYIHSKCILIYLYTSIIHILYVYIYSIYVCTYTIIIYSIMATIIMNLTLWNWRHTDQAVLEQGRIGGDHLALQVAGLSLREWNMAIFGWENQQERGGMASTVRGSWETARNWKFVGHRILIAFNRWILGFVVLVVQANAPGRSETSHGLCFVHPVDLTS